MVINRSDLATDRLWNGADMGGQRTLSGVIAHETCHGIERRRFGVAIELTKPAWLREGYCDHVAQESSLTDGDVARLRSVGQSHPALPYHEGRRRVAQALEANGGNVDTLFAEYQTSALPRRRPGPSNGTVNIRRASYRNVLNWAPASAGEAIGLHVSKVDIVMG